MTLVAVVVTPAQRTLQPEPARRTQTAPHTVGRQDKVPHAEAVQRRQQLLE
jgi:hypothetical protein